jgi:hypothetical protein
MKTTFFYAPMEGAAGTENREIIIDVEKHAKEKLEHPHADPGIIILYRIKIDGDEKDIPERHVNEEFLLNLVGKTIHEFEVYQIKTDDGHEHEILLKPEDQIDLGVFGVERFITKRRIYHFFIGKKEYTTHEPKLSVKEILEDYAKVDPAQKTLAKIIPGGFHEYKDINEEISLKDCPHFTLFDNSPVHVS